MSLDTPLALSAPPTITLPVLRAIASLLKTLPVGTYPRIMLGTNFAPAVDQLRALGARCTTSPHRSNRLRLDGSFGADEATYGIERAELEIDGVAFEAQIDFPITDAEYERLICERVQRQSSLEGELAASVEAVRAARGERVPYVNCTGCGTAIHTPIRHDESGLPFHSSCLREAQARDRAAKGAA